MSLLNSIYKSILLGFVFISQLVRSSVAVARQVLGDSSNLRPAILAVPLDLRSNAGVTTLANCVSLTPGTTSLHVAQDEHILYVHAMDARDPEAVRRAITERLERPTMRVLP